MTLEELRARQAEIEARLRTIDAEAGADNLTGDVAAEFDTLTAEHGENKSKIGRLEQMLALARSSPNDARLQSGSFTPPAVPGTGNGGSPRDDALRAVEALADRAPLSSTAGDTLSAVVERDRSGADARYIAAVSDEAYESAFAKVLADPTTGHLRFTPAEADAFRRASEARSIRAALSTGDTEGGFAVPSALDPTVMLISDGALNPIRTLAEVTTIATSEWKGVTSAGITAAFVPENTESTDDSPTLAQPIIVPQRAQAFVPFSIEIGQDWSGIRSELGRLLADAKDVLEASAFITGPGEASNQPEGIVVGLDAASILLTATASTYAIGDIYLLVEDLPSRFAPRASFLAALPVILDSRRFVGGGSTEPEVVNADLSRMVGKPLAEVSTMDADSSIAGNDILLVGDIRAGYRIVDRIGLSIELVPHLMGANRRPTGQRGLYAFWRTSAAVQVDNALRLLRVRTT